VSISRIILLAGHPEAAFLANILTENNPELVVEVANDPGTLAGLCQTATAGTRLISFCSAVIVPKALLETLPGPSYNFHPGPPERPGRFPAVFAVYEGAERFGITVHEMVAAVDAGPIVAAEWFAVPETCDLSGLETLAFSELLDKFRQLAPFLACIDRPLPRLLVRWSGRKTRLADRDALGRITAEMDPGEVQRRTRACGGQVTLA
jgi:methionyl-tRNA formyltransferase